ncbi:MAG: antibiotic ABC transporter ATP-binding protein [Phycisphaerae bacterium]|nr:MAG: antibiotic ABC transporter ATP-binding protein [Phycisphaerae bacterium]
MLRLENLVKTFGALRAVDGVSIEIRPGEVFGLLGPNGAGKSTTLAMAVGLTAPDSGRVEITGHGSPTSPSSRRVLGIAPQALALYHDLTAEENLRFFGRLYGLRGSALKGRVDTVLAMVGLGDRRRDRVKTYSGGMQRRLNLAAALVHDPALVLLDEPTAGVDPQSRNNILDLVRLLASQGRTIVYTTHYMEEAQKLCTRVGIIDKGRLLGVGTVDELIARHGGKAVVTIERDDGAERVESDDPMVVVAKAAAAGGTLRGVRIDRPDLESVFLAMTGRRLRD